MHRCRRKFFERRLRETWLPTRTPAWRMPPLKPQRAPARNSSMRNRARRTQRATPTLTSSTWTEWRKRIPLFLSSSPDPLAPQTLCNQWTITCTMCANRLLLNWTFTGVQHRMLKGHRETRVTARGSHQPNHPLSSSCQQFPSA